MSKHNKVNKDHYVQGGRLTPDEMARERMKQSQVSSRARGRETVIAKQKTTRGPAPSPRRTAREE